MQGKCRQDGLRNEPSGAAKSLLDRKGGMNEYATERPRMSDKRGGRKSGCHQGKTMFQERRNSSISHSLRDLPGHEGVGVGWGRARSSVKQVTRDFIQSCFLSEVLGDRVPLD